MISLVNTPYDGDLMEGIVGCCQALLNEKINVETRIFDIRQNWPLGHQVADHADHVLMAFPSIWPPALVVVFGDGKLKQRPVIARA